MMFQQKLPSKLSEFAKKKTGNKNHTFASKGGGVGRPRFFLSWKLGSGWDDHLQVALGNPPKIILGESSANMIDTQPS